MRKIADAFHLGKDLEGFVRSVDRSEVAQKDHNISPSQFIGTNTKTECRELQPILDDLGSLWAQEVILDKQLQKVFSGLGYLWRGQQ